MVTGSYLPIITLNVNGFNAPTKRHIEWTQKQTNNNNNNKKKNTALSVNIDEETAWSQKKKYPKWLEETGHCAWSYVCSH